jgi:hypothetical protein
LQAPCACNRPLLHQVGMTLALRTAWHGVAGCWTEGITYQGQEMPVTVSGISPLQPALAEHSHMLQCLVPNDLGEQGCMVVTSTLHG